MRTIYATQDSKTLDLSPALQHGDKIVAITSPGDANYSIPQTRSHIERVLGNFDNEKDLILLVGDPTVMMLVGMELMAKSMCGEMKGDKVHLLKWNRMTQSYIELEVEV